MIKSKRVMRRQILSKLYDLLQEQSPMFYTRETFINGELSLHEIDAICAFRYNSPVEELRRALDRLEEGTFGICLGCKAAISQEVLDDDPTQRICTACEQKYIHVHQPPLVQHPLIAR